MPTACMHPQIVLEVLNGTVYDLVKAGTEGCDGGLLGPLLDILSGCAYLHARSPPILHRDLKVPPPRLLSTRTLPDTARGSASRRACAPAAWSPFTLVLLFLF